MAQKGLQGSKKSQRRGEGRKSRDRKGQIVDTLDFAGHMISVTATRLSHYKGICRQQVGIAGLQ